jgi:hypothetical protein
VSGSLQLFLNVPVSGGFIVNAKQLSIIVSTDLQKDQNRVPYIRILSCEMLDGLVDAKLVDMGLLTEAINIKYKVIFYLTSPKSTIDKKFVIGMKKGYY